LILKPIVHFEKNAFSIKSNKRFLITFTLKGLPLYTMMKIRLNREQLERVHAEIYGEESNSPISIQLQKLDKYIEERQGKVSKPDTFDQFEYGFYA
jgi:hypothetical protein